MLKTRVFTLTTGGTGDGGGSTGTASRSVRLGAAHGRIMKMEVKGNSSGVDQNSQWRIRDADGREILAATALNAATDDSTVLNTNTSYSSVGVGIYIGPAEAEVIDRAGDPAADTEGMVLGLPAKSPVTVAISTAGTDTDVHQVTLWVEV